MKERLEFEPKIKKGLEESNSQEREASFCEKSLSKHEKSNFFHIIKGIKEEVDPKKKKQQIKFFLPHLLGKRLEERLGQEKKEFLEFEGDVLKKGGFQWITEKEVLSEEAEDARGLLKRFGVEKNPSGFEIEEGVQKDIEGLEEEKLKVWRSVIIENSKKIVPEGIILGEDEVGILVDDLLVEINDISDEDMDEIEKQKKELKKNFIKNN